MIRIGLLILLLVLNSRILAQPTGAPRIPENYHWESIRDYKKDEDLIVRTLQWLCKNPVNNEIEYRSKASLFVMEWIAGSPRIKIEIKSNALPFYEAYPDLLFPYIQGLALKKLSKPTCNNELEAMVSGFNTIGFMIDSDPLLRKEKALHSLLKAYKKNKMQSFVEKLNDSNTNP